MVNNANDTSLWNELKILWLYRYWILSLSSVVVLGTLVYTLPFVTPPEYLAVSSFIPPSLEDIKSLNFLKIKFNGFGAAKDEDLERYAAALQSDSAFYWIEKKFNLTKYYGLEDISDPSKREKKLREKYNEQIKIKVTALSTVEIQVYDTDPQHGAAIANAFLDYADNFTEKIARRKEGIALLEKSLAEIQNIRKQLQDTLGYYRSRYKIYHFDDLSEVVSARILTEGFNQREFHQYYDKVQAIEHQLRYLEEHIADMFNELVFRKENLQTYPSLISIVSYGIPSKVRVRPQRLIYLSLSTIFSLFLFSIGAIYYHKYKHKN
ncbi:MAG: hypothetical protein RML72_12510 [Bacteroidia bacterium]|nr:hypothetical protein [Bacteroidia bacterium]MDW8159681.1 hypothetical protein [Bacteroidia bacterium]